jgi:hypothetical protein
MSKQTTLTPVAGAEREHLERLVQALDQRAETERSQNRLVSAAELTHAAHYLRRLLPPAGRP